MEPEIAHTRCEAPLRFDPDRPRPNLTAREKQILRLVCDGLTNAQIALFLRISQDTVKTEIKRIFKEIDVDNRTHAVAVAFGQGWLAGDI